jgi:hypothetical protein
MQCILSNNNFNLANPNGILPVANGGTGTNSGTLSKLQKLAAAAARGNLIQNAANSSAAVITSPVSAPSTTGFTNIMGGTTGFVASPTATVVSGNNVVGVSSTTGLVAGQWVVESGASFTFPTHILPGTKITSVDTVNVTVTLSKAPIASGSITLRAVNQFMDFIGGVPFDFSGNLVLGGAQTTSATPAYTSTDVAIEFETDAENFSSATLLLKCFQNGASPNSFRVAIDGSYTTYTPTSFGTSEWISIVFPTLSSSNLTGTHSVRIELPLPIAIQQLWVPTGSSVWKLKNPIPMRLSFFGDSYMYSGASGTWTHDALAARVANRLGCLFDNNSVAGTGYINNGSANYAWSAPQRTNNVAYRAYDAIVVFGSVNDSGQSAAAMQVAALATWQGLRANAPNAPIFIFGVPTTGNVSAANATILEQGQIAAFAQWGDANSYYFPITTDPNGAWINANNLSTYIAGDNTHPTDPQGYSFISDKMVQAIQSILGNVAY